jgi:hypothetical protein
VDTTAAVMTYDSLVDDMQSYAQRDDTRFLTQIPRLIMMAENRIASEVRGLGFIRSVTSQFIVGVTVITKPPRWRETKSFNFADSNSKRRFLVLRPYEYCRTFWPNPTLTSEPRFYADYDYNHWLIAPTPSDALNYEVMYHERPRPLSGTTQTNWTTEFAPQLLLFACLLEVSPFLKDFEQKDSWQSAYDRAAMALTAEDKDRLQDRSAEKEK